VLDMRPTTAGGESVPALAAPQPVTRVSAPSQIVEEIGDLGFLYAPSGLPGIAALSLNAVAPTPAATNGPAQESRPSARLPMESAGLDSLMSSFLTARTPSANPAASPDVPAADGGSEQLARTAHQSVITQLYSQF